MQSPTHRLFVALGTLGFGVLLFHVAFGQDTSLGVVPDWRARVEDVPSVLNKKAVETLQSQKNALDGARAEIDRDVKSLNTDCSHVQASDTTWMQECKKRQQELMRRIKDYESDLKTYKEHRAAAIDAELSELDRRISATKRAIQKFASGLKGYQDSLDEWTRLPLEARTNAHRAALDTCATVFLEKLAVKKEKAIELKQDELKNIERLLRERVRIDDLYNKAVIHDELQSLKTDASVLQLLSRIKDGVGAIPSGDAEKREAELSAVLKVIAIVNRDPKIRLLTSDGELVIADVYAYWSAAVARERIDQLLSLGDQQLSGLSALITAYKSDINNRKILLAARAKPDAK